MWRSINKSVPRAFTERRNVSTYAGDLLSGACRRARAGGRAECLRRLNGRAAAPLCCRPSGRESHCTPDPPHPTRLSRPRTAGPPTHRPPAGHPSATTELAQERIISRTVLALAPLSHTSRSPSISRRSLLILRHGQVVRIRYPCWKHRPDGSARSAPASTATSTVLISIIKGPQGNLMPPQAVGADGQLGAE